MHFESKLDLAVQSVNQAQPKAPKIHSQVQHSTIHHKDKAPQQAIELMLYIQDPNTEQRNFLGCAYLREVADSVYELNTVHGRGGFGKHLWEAMGMLGGHKGFKFTSCREGQSSEPVLSNFEKVFADSRYERILLDDELCAGVDTGLFEPEEDSEFHAYSLKPTQAFLEQLVELDHDEPSLLPKEWSTDFFSYCHEEQSSKAIDEEDPLHFEREALKELLVKIAPSAPIGAPKIG